MKLEVIYFELKHINILNKIFTCDIKFKLVEKHVYQVIAQFV